MRELLPHRIYYRGRDFRVSGDLWKQGLEVVKRHLDVSFLPLNERKYFVNDWSDRQPRFEPDIEDES